jgi:hypothetical protein
MRMREVRMEPRLVARKTPDKAQMRRRKVVTHSCEREGGRKGGREGGRRG